MPKLHSEHILCQILSKHIYNTHSKRDTINRRKSKEEIPSWKNIFSYRNVKGKLAS